MSTTAVERAIKDGRITEIDGKIDPVLADAQWERNSQVRAGSSTPNAADDGPLKPRAEGYHEHRARRERAEADIAEMKAAELRGEMIHRAAVERAEQKKATTIRESLLQVPAQLAPVLAAESDVGHCHDILMESMLAVLAKISGA